MSRPGSLWDAICEVYRNAVMNPPPCQRINPKIVAITINADLEDREGRPANAANICLDALAQQGTLTPAEQKIFRELARKYIADFENQGGDGATLKQRYTDLTQGRSYPSAEPSS